MGIRQRLAHAVSAFTGPEDRIHSVGDMLPSYGVRPDPRRSSIGGEKTIIGAIYNRIGIDAASVEILHCRVDEDKKYTETIPGPLNLCFTEEANLDQAASAFWLDAVMTLFEKGVIAIVPTKWEEPKRPSAVSPVAGSFTPHSLRVGEIVHWEPDKVRISVYDEEAGRRKEITMEKRMVAIVENPLYTVMNEPNSTLQRLIRKLSLLDSLDEQTSSGKLDLIIQLPYVIKTETRKQQAEARRKDIEMQLAGSKYGIAYTDGTEKITQLNRPVENTMLAQVEYLMNMLYSQLGLTPAIFDGTADEKQMLNYHNRTIAPVLTAITQEMRRKFLTKTARSQGHSIEFFRDPFKLVTLGDLAEIADKMTRNKIMTANEIRPLAGLKPSKDPAADKLENSNMPVDKANPPSPDSSTPVEKENPDASG